MRENSYTICGKFAIQLEHMQEHHLLPKSSLFQGIFVHKEIKESDCQNAVVVTPGSYVISDHNDFLE